MDYRLRNGRTARVAVPAVVGVAVLVGTGFALLLDDSPDTIATFSAPTTAPPTTEPPISEVAVTSTTPPTTTTIPPTTAPPTTLAPTTTVEATTTTVETLPEQPPEPIAPPSDPRGYEEQIRLGSISIPKLGVDAPLLEGIRLTTLDNGPGHWPGTAMPGEVGNVVVAAHRTSHGGPFRHIDTLIAGDVVNFETDTGTTTYVVTGTQVVNPDAIWIVDPTDTPTATLFACHPPGSVAQRIVVNLELQS